MNQLPLISILVPIYGTEKYIEKCARSLFNQSYKNIEYIFINDCTKDNSIKILTNVLEDFPTRKQQIHIINHETNMGLAGARLTAFQHATGDYIWCVDSDDYVSEKAIETILPYIFNNYDFIVFNYCIQINDEIKTYNSKPLSINRVLINEISPSIWKCIVKKDLYTKNNIYPRIGINSSEDYLLTARLILKAAKPILLNNAYLYFYNAKNVYSYMNNMNIKNYQDSADSAIAVYDFYKTNNAEKKYRIGLAYRMAMCYLRLKKIDSTNLRCKTLMQKIKRSYSFIFFITKLPIKIRIKFLLLKIYRKIVLK